MLACAGFWVWHAIFPPEPLYHGKPLGRWLEEASFSAGSTLETTAAIQGMGTNALPVLLRMVAARDSDFKQGLANVGGARLQRFFRLVPAQHYHLMATWGFDALGPSAKPAVPALTKLLTASDEDVSSTAAYCLGVIGPAARPAVPLLIQCLSNAVTKGSSTSVNDMFSTAAKNRSRVTFVLPQPALSTVGRVYT